MYIEKEHFAMNDADKKFYALVNDDEKTYFMFPSKLSERSFWYVFHRLQSKKTWKIIEYLDKNGYKLSNFRQQTCPNEWIEGYECINDIVFKKKTANARDYQREYKKKYREMHRTKIEQYNKEYYLRLKMRGKPEG